jgi:hypothetical protein
MGIILSVRNLPAGFIAPWLPTKIDSCRPAGAAHYAPTQSHVDQVTISQHSFANR